ncbi:hypothetical protein COOONC_01550 [Cooperia oncophora]
MHTDRDFPIQEKEMEQPLPYQPPEQQIFEEELLAPVIRLDPRDIQSTIQAVKSNHRQRLKHLRRTLSSEKYSDASMTLIIPPLEKCSDVVKDVIQDLAVRNETLIIADSHPQIFQFLDSKNKSDSLKSIPPSYRPVTVAEEKATGPKNACKTTSEFLAGSIHCFLSEWLALEPSKLVSTKCLTDPSKPVHSGNRKSAVMHKDFVNKEIKSFSQPELFKKFPSVPATLFTFTLYQWQKFLHVPKIKLDDISGILNALPEGGFMATFDLKAGHHHVKTYSSEISLIPI